MTDELGPNPSLDTGHGTTDETPPTLDGEAPSEPAVERSQFSQWLASFGLGELQNPLLTRTRPPVPRRPAS